MKLSWVFPFAIQAPLLFAQPAPSLSAHSLCKCVYGQKCWPSQQEFSRLASRLSTPLVYPNPTASACYSHSNTSGTCDEVVANYRDAHWRADNPGSLQNINFETFTFSNGTIDACYLNSTLGVPCGQGSIPPVGIDARTVQDVQAAIKFASKHHLRLVIKNTGHDYLGRSTGRGALLLWTHHLKDITYNAQFRPSGAPSKETYDALTVGSGVQWREAYDAAQAHGRVIVGGLSADASVGAAGGWVQGGGHSALSPTYGLGVDNVIQFDLVTADGRYLSANSHQHEDLFWALRGGGGGTFGVLTSVTYRLHPATPLSGIFFLANFTTPENAQSSLTEFVRHSPSFADASWGGYAFMSETNLFAFYIAPNSTVEEAQLVADPFVSSVPGLTHFIQPFPGFYEWYQSFFIGQNATQVGTNSELGSRFIHRQTIADDPAKVVSTILSLPGGVEWNQVAGGAVSDVEPHSVGLNPAWRTAISNIVFSQSWAEGATSEEINVIRAENQAALDRFEALDPAAGTYFNEASLFERNYKTTFFGAHYNKLSAIKRRYDPKDLFIVAKGVGSEDWDDNLVCRR